MDQRDDILACLKAFGHDLSDAGWDLENQAAVIESLAEFTTGTLAPTNAEADRAGCRVEDGRALMPDNLAAAYRDYVELGWHQLHLPTEHGGAGAPPELALAATELLTAANHAFQMVTGLVPGAVKLLDTFGTDNQKTRYIPPLVDGTALATMCLSEPGAGSDLGAIRCKAEPAEDGTYRLTGEKIFVSGGSQNLSDTILHMVLARTGAPEDGVKGLSLFACPARKADDTPNAIKLIRIEEKLGLHASPTCQLSFDGAQADLIGAPGEGLKAMFVMMNEARLDVAMQGVAHAATATRIATTYAEGRIQGGTPIAQHGDVRRMLERMDALAMGSRAMALHTATLLENVDLAALLTPVCKAWCTDAATEAADLGIQVLGGYGYLPEYGLEQIWRDARVTRLYEGTNGILAMTLANRLLTGGNGKHRAAFEQALASTTPPLRSVWQQAADIVAVMPDRGEAAHAFMRLTGLIWFAASWQCLAHSNTLPANRVARIDKTIQRHIAPEAESLLTQIRLVSAD